MIKSFIVEAPLFKTCVQFSGLFGGIRVGITDAFESLKLSKWDVRDKTRRMKAVSSENGVAICRCPVDAGVQKTVCVHIDVKVQ